MSDEAADAPGRRLQDAKDLQVRRPMARPKGIRPLQLLTICVAQLNEAIQITMPYTVAVYMVRDFEGRKAGSQADEQRVGTLTGTLGACFCAAQFVSSFPWGRVSDRLGRKPMLVMSNLSSCISVIGFGLSRNFAAAALFRVAGGLFNCTFVCLKSMIGESCDVNEQARPLSILSLCWGLGTVIGPTLGGVLSRPCDTLGPDFALCGPTSFLRTRPFFLPCGVVGLVSFLALLSSLVFMEETLPSRAARSYARLAGEEGDTLDGSRARDSCVSEMELSRLTDAGASGEEDEDAVLQLVAPGQASLGSATEATRDVCVDMDGRAAEGGSDSEDSRGWEGQERDKFLRRNDTASLLGGSAPGKLALSEEPGREPGIRKPLEHLVPTEERPDTGTKWYKDKQVLLTVFGYAMICLLYNLMDEVTPIYGSAARSDGGLGLSTLQLAVPLAIGGVSIFVWSMFFFPWLQRLIGVVRTCRLGIALTMPLSLALALPSMLPVGPVVLQLLLAAVLSLKNIMATNSFTASVMMVNMAAPQSSIGEVNGASQAAASFVRAVGPAVGGWLWARSVALPIAGHQALPFAVTAAGFAVPLAVFGHLRLPGGQGTAALGRASGPAVPADAAV